MLSRVCPAPRTPHPEWFWRGGVKGHGSRDLTVSGARSGSVCNFPSLGRGMGPAPEGAEQVRGSRSLGPRVGEGAGWRLGCARTPGGGGSPARLAVLPADPGRTER